MRSRVLGAILSVSALAILLFGIPLAVVVDKVVGEDAALRVERAAVLASRVVPVDFATGDDPVELPADRDGIAIGLYDRDGTLITGSGPQRADQATREALLNRVVAVEVAGYRVVTVPVAADAEALADLDRLERTVSEILAHSRSAAPTTASLPLRELLKETEKVWRGRFGNEARDFAVTVPDDLPPIRGSAGIVRQSLDVILDNALHHGEGSVGVSVEVTPESLTLTISDEGPGFTPDGPPDRTITGRSGRDGRVHGLGLPLAQRLMESISGRLVIRRAGPCPEVALVLPIAPQG